ncbi:hypothetical protein GCM10027578_29710 [Spirosoma luteolum]
MPLSKNQQQRLLRINDRLNRWGGKGSTAAELATLLDVSIRTIKDDIAELRAVYNAPIGHARARGGYHYTQPFDLGAQITLTASDLTALHTAVATLNQFRNLSVFEGLHGTVDKIDKAVRFRADNTTALSQAILFESVPYTHGSHWINLFLEAIRTTSLVAFDHQRYDTEVTKHHQLFPYIVKEHRNRWYVVGWHPAYQQIRVFGLDRILPDSACLVDTTDCPPAFDAAAYFRHALGVVVNDAPVETIILSFTRQQGLHFRAQPLAPFREQDVLVDTETELRVRLSLIINDELVIELARLGHQVRVLEPPQLIIRLMAHLQRALDQYAVMPPANQIVNP